MTDTIVMPYPDGNPKTAAGSKKPGTIMIPSAALLHLGQVMRLGASKYGPANWREKGVTASVYLDAASRHVLSWVDGEDTDPESGASHLAHAMACFAIVIDALECQTLNDDRPAKGQAARMISQFASEGKF